MMGTAISVAVCLFLLLVVHVCHADHMQFPTIKQKLIKNDHHLMREQSYHKFGSNTARTEAFTTELLYRLDWVPCKGASAPPAGYG